MNCPVCSKEMKLGYIVSRREMFWLNRNEKCGWLSGQLSDTKIAGLDMSVSKTEAFRCDECKITVVKDQN